MTKIDIFSGFLGAGKTTLIKKLIAEAYSGEKLVLIENEFGEINIDGGFLKESGIEISEMSAGCICCSLVGDFNKALKEVVEQFHPDITITMNMTSTTSTSITIITITMNMTSTTSMSITTITTTVRSATIPSASATITIITTPTTSSPPGARRRRRSSARKLLRTCSTSWTAATTATSCVPRAS